eukprot:7529603-Ditylum_brightwellii.AAC.1
MGKGIGGLVVGLYLGQLLGVAGGFKEVAKAHRCLAVMEQRSALCLCHRANDMFECPALNEDGGIVRCFVIVESMWIGSALKIASNAAFCAVDDKIGCIGVNLQ